ncbi:39505_t:CDS:2 [Gigaspora margarita]|uniref:39505_t:CDS:1 n=1 Tax=Gigaspora margarita TaxID=4874 RepID=A0ABN7UYX2_GIGMA|nr:39505_t:CDS:2 [Gigaspora margarita]
MDTTAGFSSQSTVQEALKAVPIHKNKVGRRRDNHNQDHKASGVLAQKGTSIITV